MQTDELQRIADKVTELLREKSNYSQWTEGYQKYISALIAAEERLRGHDCAAPKPLRLYVSTNQVRRWTKEEVSLDARLYGISVATLFLQRGEMPKWSFKPSGLRKVAAVLTPNHPKAVVKLEKLLSAVAANPSLSTSHVASAFNCMPEGMEMLKVRDCRESAVESALLENFDFRKSDGKVLPYIRPVGISPGKNHPILPLQLPAPLNAQILYKKSWDAAALSFRLGRGSGHMDILARIGAGRHPSTRLAILELKKEGEDMNGAIRQAVAYAAFVRSLLRQAEGDAIGWWRFFGFGDGSVPPRLALLAVGVLPMSRPDAQIEWPTHRLQLGEDTISTHYLYVNPDDVNPNNNPVITSLPAR